MEKEGMVFFLFLFLFLCWVFGFCGGGMGDVCETQRPFFLLLKRSEWMHGVSFIKELFCAMRLVWLVDGWMCVCVYEYMCVCLSVCLYDVLAREQQNQI